MILPDVKSRHFFFAAVALTLAFCPAPADAGDNDTPLAISAESIVYDMESEIIAARGNVTIKKEDGGISAEEADISIAEKLIFLRGSVRLEQHGDVVYFSSGAVNSDDDSSEMLEVRGFAKSWVFSAKMVKSRDGKYAARSGSFTTCDRKKPHYKVTATRMTILPGRFVSATNAVFHLGKIPIFYLPYWWRSLEKGRLYVNVDPGYNNIDGFFAKGVVSYDYSDYASTKLLADYFSRRGTGVGLDSVHHIPSKLKSAVYLYRIREDTTKSERWNAKSLLWAALKEKWSAYSEINYSSDESFNESYYGESWKPVEREINSNLFFTRQDEFSSLSVGFSRKDTYDSADRVYRRSSLYLPKIGYTRYKAGKYLGFYPEYSFSYNRASIGPDAPFYSNLGSNFSATAQRRLGKNVVLSPYFGLEETLSENTSNVFILNGKYNIGSGLRFSFWRHSYVHFNRVYTQKFLPGGFDPDPAGRETDALGAVLFLLPAPDATWKMGSGYDYIGQKYTSLNNELTYSVAGNSVLLNHVYSVEKSKYESLLLVFSHSYWANASVYHNASLADTLSLGLSTEFPIFGKDKISFQINGNMERGVFKPLAQQLKFDKNLHCWEAWLIARRREPLDRPPIDEIYFNVALKFDDITFARKREMEKEFYPWR